MQQCLTTKLNQNICYITMDDGKVNAVGPEMVRQLNQAIDLADDHQAIIVLTGRQGIFSAGFDLKHMQRGAAEAAALTASGAHLVARLLRRPQPVMSVCTGHAYPMGAFLLMGSDYVVGINGDFQLGLNEVQIGIEVPAFAVELARYRLSPSFFRRTVQLAEMFSPSDAMTAGLLDEVCSPIELDAIVQKQVERLNTLHAGKFSATKAKVNRDFLRCYEASIDQELAAAS